MYSVLLIVHLLAAIAFIGTLFFEVVIWHSAREELAWSAQFTSDQAIARRARRVLHLVVIVLYGAGVGLAWHYWGMPWSGRFALMLSLKILLALSIIGHYLLLAYWLSRKRLGPTRALWIRRSILGHMVLIVILAKSLW
ncbi:membrane protein [Pseudomonas trivialis]|uniref:Membrane protein n=1 Tax=Pseudomonas trivialis TaxID=200450 RepID=A0A0H5AYB4_9PSED|nr:membrane protein [Pseudomonas trivialis]AKS09537.1 membrane protein [Pseudomonas trivialis]